MPAEAIPFVAAVIALFTTFGVVLGVVSVWSAIPRRRRRHTYTASMAIRRLRAAAGRYPSGAH